MNAVSELLAADVTATPERSWVDLILQQHRQIEHALEQVECASESQASRRAEVKLRFTFAAHASAEETVIYPALTLLRDRPGPTDHGKEWLYLWELRALEPLTPRYRYVLRAAKTTLLEHMHAEETTWLPALRHRTQGKLQHRLGRALREHYDRYSKIAAALLSLYALLVASADLLDDVLDLLSPCMDGPI